MPNAPLNAIKGLGSRFARAGRVGKNSFKTLQDMVRSGEYETLVAAGMNAARHPRLASLGGAAIGGGLGAYAGSQKDEGASFTVLTGLVGAVNGLAIGSTASILSGKSELANRVRGSVTRMGKAFMEKAS